MPWLIIIFMNQISVWHSNYQVLENIQQFERTQTHCNTAFSLQIIRGLTSVDCSCFCSASFFSLSLSSLRLRATFIIVCELGCDSTCHQVEVFVLIFSCHVHTYRWFWLTQTKSRIQENKFKSTFTTWMNFFWKLGITHFQSEEEVLWIRGPPVTYFCPALDPPKNNNTCKGPSVSTSSVPSFIKIHQAVLEKKSKMWQ